MVTIFVGMGNDLKNEFILHITFLTMVITAPVWIASG